MIQTAKLDWNAIEALSDEQLKNILHPQKSRLLKKYINQINFQELYKKLSKKGVTLLLLWQEYRFNTQSEFHIRHLLACIMTLFVKPIFLIRMSIMRVKEHMLIIRG